MFHRSHRECVITDDNVIDQPHIGLRSSAVLILYCVLLEEAIEDFMSAVERFNCVMRLKFLDTPSQRFSLKPGAGVASKKPGSARRRCI